VTESAGEARASLARLRDMGRQPSFKANIEFKGFLREAESLIEGK
jgi:hypothetical protein